MQKLKILKINRTVIAYFVISLASCIPAFGQKPEYNILSNITDTNVIVREINNANDIKKDHPDSAKQMLMHALRLSLKSNYGEGIRNAAHKLMILNYNQQQYTAAIKQADLLIAYAKSPENNRLLGEAYLCKGTSYQVLENYNNAWENYERSIYYAPDNDKKAHVYNNISVLMSTFRLYDKALYYINMALDATDTPRSGLVANKAIAYKGLGDFKKALIYYDSAYHTASNITEKVRALFYKILFLSQIDSNDEALIQFQQLNPFLKKDSLSRKLKVLVYLSGGYAYLGVQDYRNAEKYLLKANKLAHFLSNNDRRLLMYKLSVLYYATKNYKKAYYFSNLCFTIEDSIKSAAVLFQVNELETKFRTAQKDKELAEQKVIISESKGKLYRSRTWSIAIVSGLVILLLLLWIRYYYLKQKNQKLKSEKEIARLQAMMEGEEKERTRLSHELHDGVNSSLAATASYLQTIEQLYPGMGTSEPFLKAKQLLQSTSAEIRLVAHNLAPHVLIQNGLKYAIEEFCHNLFPQNVSIEVQAFGDEQFLSENAALFIYRTAQELLHNVHKHAQATEVIVMSGILENQVSLTIEDNGKGMPAGAKSTGIGLENLKEKIIKYNGRTTIDSTPGKGTVVHVCIPVEKGQFKITGQPA